MDPNATDIKKGRKRSNVSLKVPHTSFQAVNMENWMHVGDGWKVQFVSNKPNATHDTIGSKEAVIKLIACGITKKELVKRLQLNKH